MTSFEGIKRDFGPDDEEEIQEVGPIALSLPSSDHYDEDEQFVKLT